MNQIRNLLISSAEYTSRRSILAQNIRNRFKENRHLIILSSSDVQYKTRHIPRPYHQDTSFYYYTGFMKKNAILLMDVIGDNMTSLLFIDRPSEDEVLWNGPYPSEEEASLVTGVERVSNREEWSNYLKKTLKEGNISILWTSDGGNCLKKASVEHRIRSMDINQLADIQRVIKSLREVEIMRESAKITCEALKQAMASSQSDIDEHQLLGRLTNEIHWRGGKLAYPPVIAGGERANIIHYLEGDNVVRDGELVLVDVGADVNGYYSDVTRTWPVNGRYSQAQAILYDILYSIHSDCIKACTSDKSLNNMMAFMFQRIEYYLKKEGIVKNSRNIHQVCPHHIGHYLGLDIHDTPSISTDIPLSPGMVFPLEPGLYFPSNCDFVDPCFRGIGMRLEDDFLMTDSGTVDCLTNDLPRSRSDIENQCHSSLR